MTKAKQHERSKASDDLSIIVMPLAPSYKRRICQHIELILPLIRRPLVEPEAHTTDKHDNGARRIQPNEQRILRQRGKSLADSVGEGAHEVPVRGNQRPHVLGRLGEGVLETGNRREDFREADEHVGHGLHPHGEGSRVVVARVHVLAAGAELVDVVLDDGGAYHGQGGEHEAEGHALDGGEADAGLAESRVQESIDDGDEDDEGDGVEVGDDVVGDAVERHGVGLRRQVAVHLVVGEPVERDPGEAGAGAEATSHLVDPGVVEGHPAGLVVAELAGLDVLPEAVRLEILARLHRINGPLALLGVSPQLPSLDQDGTSRRAQVVLVAAEPEDERAAGEEDGGQQPRQPETHILLNVNHADLASEGANIDEHVKVQEDAGEGDVGIRDDALAGLGVDNDA